MPLTPVLALALFVEYPDTERASLRVGETQDSGQSLFDIKSIHENLEPVVTERDKRNDEKLAILLINSKISCFIRLCMYTNCLCYEHEFIEKVDHYN